MSKPERKAVQLSPADPFNASRLWGDEKYNLQNMLIRQHRMPFSAPAEFLGDVYSDRLYEATSRAFEQVVQRSSCKVYMGGDACNWFQQCSGEDFLAYAQILSDAIHGSGQNVLDDVSAAADPSKPRVRGARMIRFTNVSSGYPTYLWNFYYENDGPHDQRSAPLTQPKRERYPRGMFGPNAGYMEEAFGRYFDDGY